MTERVVPLVAAAAATADQVGIVVPRLEEALGAYGRNAEWRIWTYGPATLARQSYRGREGSFAIRLALSATVPQMELIEPLAGPSLYHEWVDAHGYGLHHLGFIVEDMAATVRDMQAAGYPLLQSGEGTGADGTGGFAYFDTTDALGLITEAIQRPRERRPPEGVWPHD